MIQTTSYETKAALVANRKVTRDEAKHHQGTVVKNMYKIYELTDTAVAAEVDYWDAQAEKEETQFVDQEDMAEPPFDITITDVAACQLRVSANDNESNKDGDDDESFDGVGDIVNKENLMPATKGKGRAKRDSDNASIDCRYPN